MKTNHSVLGCCLCIILITSISLYAQPGYNAVDWGITLDDSNHDPDDDTKWDMHDEVEQVIVDNTTYYESIFILGRTYSTVNGTDYMYCDGNSNTYLGNGDVFVACYQGIPPSSTACGYQKWLVFLGNSFNFDYGYCMALDHDLLGNPILYVAGSTINNSTTADYCGNICSAIYQDQKVDGNDAFIARLNGNNGDIEDWTFFGGGDGVYDNEVDIISAITVFDHEVYFCGYTESDNIADDPDITTEPPTTYSGGGDGFFAKMTPCLDDLLLFAYYNVNYTLGDTPEDQDRCHGIRVYEDGDFTYIALQGTTASNDDEGIATVDAFDEVNADDELDAFVGLWHVDAETLYVDWSTYLGGTGDEHGRQLDLDASNNIFVTGWTNTKDDYPYPALVCDGAFTDNLGLDSYVSKISASSTDGTPDWYTFFGGSGYDLSCGIKWLPYDGDSYVIISGYTNSDDLDIYTGATSILDELNGNSSAPYDAFVAILSDPDDCVNDPQSLVYFTYLGGTNDEFTDMTGSTYGGYGPYIDLGPNQELYISFTGKSDDLVSTIGTPFQYMICDYHHDGIYNDATNNWDAFLLKLTNTSDLSMVNCGTFPHREPQNQSDSDNSIVIMPNPTNLSLKIDMPTDALSYSILSLTGVELAFKSFSPNPEGEILEIDVSSLANGMYFLKIKSESEDHLVKFSVQR